MASYYFDTSALLKLYIEEQGTKEVLRLVEGPIPSDMVIVGTTVLECRSAIRRRERSGEISKLDADLAIGRIENDALSRYFVQPLTDTVFSEARRLIDVRPLKALDAIQLAGCLSVRATVAPPLTFVCADTRLCDAAITEGVDTINPLDS